MNATARARSSRGAWAVLLAAALAVAAAMALSGVAGARPIGDAADAKCLKLAIQTLGAGYNPSNYTFVGGSEGVEDLTGQATDGPDVVCGFGGFDIIVTLDEGDIFLGGAGDDRVDYNYGTFYGGVGDEYVHANYATFYGGADDDGVIGNYGTFYGGEGSDYVGLNDGTFYRGMDTDDVYENYGTFYGEEGDDIVYYDYGTFVQGPTV